MSTANAHRFNIERFAREVRENRAGEQIKLRDLAALVGGVAPSTISRVEHGHVVPGPGLFLALCRWMGAEPWRYYQDGTR